MPAPIGPSHFVDVYDVIYNSYPTAINIYSCHNIDVRTEATRVEGEDNNKLRIVSSHAVRLKDRITFQTDDGNAAEQLRAYIGGGANNLTFNWKASSQQLTTGPLPDQSVTINNLVIDDVDTKHLMKGLGSAVITGHLIGVTDDTDPVVYGNA